MKQGDRNRFEALSEILWTELLVRRCGMAQAIVDPVQLRQFAQQLKKFNESLIEQSTGLAGQLSTLSNSWRDQENKKFCEEFESHLRLLARFIESNNDHIPYLMRKAERIEEYLHQR